MQLFGCLHQEKVKTGAVLFYGTTDQTGGSDRSSAGRQALRFHGETMPFHCVSAAVPQSGRLPFRQDCWNSLVRVLPLTHNR